MRQPTAALKGRDFLRIADWEPGELLDLLDLAGELKERQRRREEHRLLTGRSLAMIFEKPSLRTRVSFEVGMQQLGGQAVHLPGPDVGLGQREPIRDFGYVLSSYVDAIMIRTFAQATVAELAEHASVPVINGLTDDAHPCQAIADALTIRERCGGPAGVRVAFVGDGNNVCSSLMVICAKLGIDFAAATPAGYEPPAPALAAARAAGGEPRLVRDPRDAATGADVVYTDVWTSMGQEEESERRRRDFEGFTVDGRLLETAAENAIVMHDLPAHLGEEITAEALYGARSAAWQQAENRLHAQKALLALIVP
jgi:ornithine carbamoyltransferase